MANNDDMKSINNYRFIYKFHKYNFDLEDHRKENLENKASVIMGFSGLITGLLSGLIALGSKINLLYMVYSSICISFFLLAGIIALYSIFLGAYRKPFGISSPETIDEDYRKSETELMEKAVKDFSDAIINNTVINDKKARILIYSYICAIMGICLTFIISIFIINLMLN
ncbi:MAG: hypothetical protein ACFFAO_13415 [Candidatus Hermodarchaeota archaeon]